jgi:hypothetical protein
MPMTPEDRERVDKIKQNIAALRMKKALRPDFGVKRPRKVNRDAAEEKKMQKAFAEFIKNGGVIPTDEADETAEEGAE